MNWKAQECIEIINLYKLNNYKGACFKIRHFYSFKNLKTIIRSLCLKKTLKNWILRIVAVIFRTLMYLLEMCFWFTTWRTRSLKKKLPIKSGILDIETAYVQISFFKWKQTCFKNRIPDFPFYGRGRMSIYVWNAEETQCILLQSLADLFRLKTRFKFWLKVVGWDIFFQVSA